MFKIKVKKSGLIARALQRAFSVGLSAALMLSLVPKSGMVSAEVPEPGRTLSGMEVNVMVASSWADNYDADFYDKISGEYATSYNTAGTALEIGTAAQLAAFAKFVNDGNNFENKFVRLTADIDLQGVAPDISYVNDGDSGFKVKIDGEVSNNWVPIGYSGSQAFNGTFDGGYHFISNMVLYNGSYDCLGLFGVVTTGEIKCLAINSTSAIICPNAGYDLAGAITGCFEGVMKNCYNAAQIFFDGYRGYIGGLVGTGGVVKNSCNVGAIYACDSQNIGNNKLGGISGKTDHIISNCINISPIYSYRIDYSKGGILGWENNDVNNCYYDKDVVGEIGAVSGSDNEANNVKGLTTAQMQGETAKLNMPGFADEKNEAGEPLWIFKEGKYPRLFFVPGEDDEPEPEETPGSSAGVPGTTTPTDGINTLIADVTVNGQPQRIIVRGSYRALPQGTRLLAQVVARHADFDQQGYDIEHEIHYQITLVDESGNPLPMPLPEDVELLLQVIPGLDKSDLEVVLAQSGIDTQFDENLVEIGGESYVLVKTNHFSPYSLIDKLTEEEKAELNKALENLSDKEKSALGAVKTGDDPSYVTILGLVMILALGLMLNSKIRPKKF